MIGKEQIPACTRRETAKSRFVPWLGKNRSHIGKRLKWRSSRLSSFTNKATLGNVLTKTRNWQDMSKVYSSWKLTRMSILTRCWHAWKIGLKIEAHLRVTYLQARWSYWLRMGGKKLEMHPSATMQSKVWVLGLKLPSRKLVSTAHSSKRSGTRSCTMLSSTLT